MLQKGAAAGSREVCLEVRKRGKKRPGGRPEALIWRRGGRPRGESHSVGLCAARTLKGPGYRTKPGGSQEGAVRSGLPVTLHPLGAFPAQMQFGLSLLPDLTSPRCGVELTREDGGRRPSS